MLLQNLTIEQKGAEKLAQVGTPLEGLNTRLLLQWFSDPDRVLKDDPYQYVGNILTNLSIIDSVRKLLSDKDRDILGILKEQLRSRVVTRRLSVLRIVKNMLMSSELHERLLSEDVGLWAEILLLIVGPEPIDDEDSAPFIADVLVELGSSKRRDPSFQVRRLVLDLIDICLSHKPSRVYLKKTGTYIIVRELHKFEKKEGHAESVMEDVDQFIDENIVQFLCRPEEGETPLEAPTSGVAAMNLGTQQKKPELPADELDPRGRDPNAIDPSHPGLVRF